eukprot:TRINITY_DN964_c0_g1_i1.p1 TRINITY_DN964_c0_g1~~TRINITY_DN964_c0_g1_i1.p1  ORF type:complete len:410 (+),score=66.39 TRINITY_DN964_c0_g1_i1:49-1230(+)
MGPAMKTFITMPMALALFFVYGVRKEPDEEESLLEESNTKNGFTVVEDGEESTYYMSLNVVDEGIHKMPEFEVARGGKQLKVPFNSRGYLMNSPGLRSSSKDEDFKKFSLIGKTVTMTVDYRGAGCGCNAAFYFVSMPAKQKGSAGDWYCDGQGVGGAEPCPEWDFMEGNAHAFNTVGHGCGPKPWKCEKWSADGSMCEVGPCDHWGANSNRFAAPEFQAGGSQIDSSKPFNVTQSYTMSAVEITLSQGSQSVKRTYGALRDFSGDPNCRSCKPGVTNGMAEELQQGQVLTISFWGNEDMSWLDACPKPASGPQSFHGYDADDSCAEYFTISDLSITTNKDVPAEAALPDAQPAAADGGNHWGQQCGEGLPPCPSGWACTNKHGGWHGCAPVV